MTTEQDQAQDVAALWMVLGSKESSVEAQRDAFEELLFRHGLDQDIGLYLLARLESIPTDDKDCLNLTMLFSVCEELNLPAETTELRVQLAMRLHEIASSLRGLASSDEEWCVCTALRTMSRLVGRLALVWIDAYLVEANTPLVQQTALHAVSKILTPFPPSEEFDTKALEEKLRERSTRFRTPQSLATISDATNAAFLWSALGLLQPQDLPTIVEIVRSYHDEWVRKEIGTVFAKAANKWEMPSRQGPAASIKLLREAATALNVSTTST